jgi:3-hydroxybutyryl-CoA dehydratase
MAYSAEHLFFEDLVVGATFISASRTITAADIAAFAAYSGDHNPMHTDAVYAANTPFGGIIAHGYGVLAIASGLGVSAPPVRTVAVIAIREWSFREAVRPGDTLHLESTIVAATPKGKSGKRGEVVWQRRVLNQHRAIVQEGQVVTLVECRGRDR